MYVEVDKKLPSIRCESYADASKICRSYIERENFGASEWNGGRISNSAEKGRGRIRSNSGKILARVSYNGKVWSGLEVIYDPFI